MDDGDARDYYGLLQVSPDCNARILEIAYHYFAKRYHPDNGETGNREKFNALQEAYSVLKDPEQRAEYDAVHKVHHVTNGKPVLFECHLEIDEEAARRDAEDHAKILFHLYKRRREHGAEPGVAGWIIQELLECSDDEFAFHAWYLKSKGFVEMTEQGLLAVTVEGVDHIIAASRPSAGRLMIAQQDASVAR